MAGKKGAASAASNAAAVAAAASTASAQPETLEDAIKLLKSLATQFAGFATKLGVIEELNSKMDALENSLRTSRDENKKLQADLVEKVQTISSLQAGYAALEGKLNDLEQYNRQWSVRVNNIPLTSDEENNTAAIREKVYELAFRPILQGAVDAGELADLPEAEDLLELAHTLPGKQGQNKPIITRFRDRNLRSLCLRLKKAHAPRTAERGPTTRAGATGSVSGGVSGGSDPRDERGRYTFPFHEDLTRANYHKMKALGADTRVHSCWSYNGQLRYRLVNSQEVKRVQSNLMSVEAILA
jgi:Spy/CpxP family protein refolding chaperone